MSSQDSSSSPASSTVDINWESPPQHTLTPNEGATELPSQQNDGSQDVVSEAVELEADSNAEHLTSNLEPAQPKSHTTSTTPTTPTCDPALPIDHNGSTQTGNRLFRIHQFKLNEFDRLRPKLEQATKDDKERKTVKLQDDADDFYNLLLVLYSSVYDLRFFSSEILKSTLKLATKYAHPTLRAFAINELEKHELEPIDRFELSRHCGVAEWMPKAIDDLCWREEPITVAEARILGPEKLVEIATRREGIKFERGSRVNISGGLSRQTIENKPELPPAIQPISQDLGGILVAGSSLLEATSQVAHSTSQESHHTTSPPIDNTSTIPLSGKVSSDTPKTRSTATAPEFTGFSPGPFSFAFDAKGSVSKASGPARQIKNLRMDRKGRAD
ncbi:hypothetical protein RhiXN_09958 [Rhizoctonia solani]|uniref:BTB domain-containing protein n=1 Tax=Rhizoctonia solani TaxID=456999 RepID=A0A8H8P1Q5_9AGAM|nr:uncharacterized protein RhiXN_09958 [Rhizoctonia solani]QRW22371.1 hypothetical protein RhiXN_09958 [Rhizoctonia solani]